MRIRVKFLANIREITDESEIELEIRPGDSIETVMKTLELRYGKGFKEATTGTTAERDSKCKYPRKRERYGFSQRVENRTAGRGHCGSDPTGCRRIMDRTGMKKYNS